LQKVAKISILFGRIPSYLLLRPNLWVIVSNTQKKIRPNAKFLPILSHWELRSAAVVQHHYLA
jgi:hypothetical protein